MSEAAAPQAPAPQTLWNRNFLIWWLGSAQSALGTSLSGIALSFLVLDQTGSAGAMGVTLALAMLPALLSPLFGTLVDRLPLRLPLVAGNLLDGLLVLGVGLAALRGDVPLGVLYGMALFSGLIAAFYGPASMGVTPRLIPPTEIERATGLMQGTSQTMRMLGLVGGGLLVSRLGSGPALVLDGVTFLVFAGLLLLVHFPARGAGAGGERFWQAFTAGLRYVRGSALLTGLPLIALLINAAFAPVLMLLPKRMQELGAGAAGFGLYEGLTVAGMAAASLALAGLGRRADARRNSVLGLAGMGAVVLGLALSQTAPQMYGLAALMGLANALTNTSIGVLFQKRVAPEYYGRVGSLLGMVGMAGMPLLLLALAPLADRLSMSLMFGVAGAATLLGALAWAAVLRREAGATAAAVAPA